MQILTCTYAHPLGPLNKILGFLRDLPGNQLRIRIRSMLAEEGNIPPTYPKECEEYKSNFPLGFGQMLSNSKCFTMQDWDIYIYYMMHVFFHTLSKIYHSCRT